MTFLRTAPIAAVVLSLTAAAHAQPQARYGAGDVLCSDYVKAARTSDIIYHQASNWLLGYVTGMNTALRGTSAQSAIVDLSNAQVLKSAMDYCASNPTSRIANAAESWYGTLPKQAAEAPKPEPKRGWFIDIDSPPSRKAFDHR